METFGQIVESVIDTSASDTSRVINVISNDQTPLEADGGNYYFLSHKEFWLAVIVLFSLLALIGFEVRLINKRNFSDDNAMKLVLITLVIMSALFLIMAGYDDQIVAPAFALFGTIAGYLFGRSEKNSNNNTDKTL